MSIVTTVAILLLTKVNGAYCIYFLIISITALLIHLYLFKKFDNYNQIFISYNYCIIGFYLFSMLNYFSSYNLLFNENIFFAIILLGSFYLIKKSQIGLYSVIFCSLLGLTFSLFELYNLVTGFNSNKLLNLFSVVLIFYLSLKCIYNLFSNLIPTKTMITTHHDMNYINLWTILSLSIVSLVACVILSQSKPTPEFIVLIIAVFSGLILWRKRSTPLTSTTITSDYLLMIVFLLVNLQEKSFFQFGPRVSILFTANDISTIQNYVIIIIAIFGVIKLWQRNSLGNLLLGTTSLYLILNQPLHIILYPIVENMQYHNGYHYFPGMWSALLPVPFAVKCLIKLIKNEHLN